MFLCYANEESDDVINCSSIVHFEDKNQENLPLKELLAHATVFYRRIENSEKTNQIRRFPIEHS